MKIKGRDELTINERLILRSPDQRQLVGEDINDREAQKHLDQLPWALAIETPTRIFFRE
jgi:hypothetical protein